MEQDRYFYKLLLVICMAALIGGCATSDSQSVLLSNSHSQGTDDETILKPLPVLPSGVKNLTLSDALDLALARNPELATSSYEIKTAKAQIGQAKVFSNPELEIELEEYNRDRDGFNSAALSAKISQRIELGGKRKWRVETAGVKFDIAGRDYESKRLDVISETTKRFWAVDFAIQRLDLAQETIRLVEKTTEAVNVRVEAGKESPLHKSKVAAELELARLEIHQAKTDLDLAKKMLAFMWGTEKTGFHIKVDNSDTVSGELPSFDVLHKHLASNPDLKCCDDDLKLATAVLSAEKAECIPDIKASAGVEHSKKDGSEVWKFGIEVPLPLFNRNQGNIASARNMVESVKAERKAVKDALVAKLVEVYAKISLVQSREITLRRKVMPAVEAAFSGAHEGYSRGKLGLLDMLDAKKSLLETRGALVDARNDYHIALADIQRLTGMNLKNEETCGADCGCSECSDSGQIKGEQK